MAMTREQTLCVQLERLRVLLTLLAFVPDGQRHDELVERTRGAIADIRKLRMELGPNAATSQAAVERNQRRAATSPAAPRAAACHRGRRQRRRDGVVRRASTR